MSAFSSVTVQLLAGYEVEVDLRQTPRVVLSDRDEDGDPYEEYTAIFKRAKPPNWVFYTSSLGDPCIASSWRCSARELSEEEAALKIVERGRVLPQDLQECFDVVEVERPRPTSGLVAYAPAFCVRRRPIARIESSDGRPSELLLAAVVLGLAAERKPISGDIVKRLAGLDQTTLRNECPTAIMFLNQLACAPASLESPTQRHASGHGKVAKETDDDRAVAQLNRWIQQGRSFEVKGFFEELGISRQAYYDDQSRAPGRQRFRLFWKLKAAHEQHPAMGWKQNGVAEAAVYDD